MCGILSAWNWSGGARLDVKVVREACDTMVHRGPDDSGIEELLKGELWLAHRRLSVLDLSEAGHQPMASKDGRFWISYNGEIYNYRELRERLAALGHRFVSSGDTEVLLAAFQQWGMDCLQELNGMWAFVIFDREAKELICSRDRFGIKPLYFYEGPEGFAAASEIRALLALGWVRPNLDRAAMGRFLLTGQADGLEATCFEGIYRLRAGHTLRVRQGRVEKKRYWQLPASDGKRDTAEDRTVESFRHLFESAVRDHLASDVPLGTCLSGGIDSGSIAIVVARQLDGPLHAFSSYFEEEGCDERPFAMEVVWGCHARSHTVRPRWEDVPSVLPRILWHLEDPAKAVGVYPQWHVMKLASEHVTVLLDGQGGDETLAGYDYYFAERARDLILQGRWLTYWKEKRATDKLPPLARMVREAFWDRRHSAQLSAEIPPWLSPSLIGREPHPTEISRHYPGDRVNERLALDLEYEMLPAFLRYEDKMGMAFSVEARVPFLDLRLVNFLFSRSSDLKCFGGWSKYLLRRAMEGILPPRVQWRADKKGFPTPFRSWFRKELYPWVRDLLSSSRLREAELLNLKEAHWLLENHRLGNVDAENRIWRWVAAALWLEQMNRLTDRQYAQPLAHKVK